jgi:hypothetical protein
VAMIICDGNDCISYQSTKAAAEVARVMTTENTTTVSWQLRCRRLCSGIFFLWEQEQWRERDGTGKGQVWDGMRGRRCRGGYDAVDRKV